jgi:immune inhibitor A
LSQDTEVAGWVRQFGVDYIEIDPHAGSRVTFEGSGLVRLTGTDPHESEFSWWSNRRNMLSSSLMRPVDLGEVETATLHFWTWYDIEENFDYGYVVVSTDEGRTWETLPGTHTTSEDPNRANYGQGYTGKSDAWLEERVDLSSYAGQQILLRFWYISDPGLNQPGWLIDDISIPEIGFSDDAEQDDSGWTVDGFVRSSNDVPQSYVVQLVEYGPHVTVRRLSLDAENKTEVELGEGTRRAVLIVSGATRWTSEPAPYRVEIRP